MKAEYDFSGAKRAKDVPHLSKLQSASAKGKTRVTMYLDDSVVKAFRAKAEAEGKGYQTLINDAAKLVSAGLKDKAQALLDMVSGYPFQNPPPYEKLIGDLAGAYARRINIQHRLVYQVLEKEKIVKILRMWTHYE